MAVLPSLPSLTSLHVLGCPKVDQHSILTLIAHTPQLQSLAFTSYVRTSSSRSFETFTPPPTGIISFNARQHLSTPPPAPSRDRHAMRTNPRQLRANVLDNNGQFDEVVVQSSQIPLVQDLRKDRPGGRVRLQYRQQPSFNARPSLSPQLFTVEGKHVTGLSQMRRTRDVEIEPARKGHGAFPRSESPGLEPRYV